MEVIFDGVLKGRGDRVLCAVCGWPWARIHDDWQGRPQYVDVLQIKNASAIHFSAPSHACPVIVEGRD